MVGDGVAILPVDTLRETLEFFEGCARLTPTVANVAPYVPGAQPATRSTSRR